MKQRQYIATTLVTVLASVFLFIPAAQAALNMKAGTGATFTSLPTSGAWTEMMQVTINPKKNRVCEVTASFTAFLGGNLIQTTLHTAANAPGPWVQVHEADGWESSAMTQAFNVTPQVPITFYMNGENQGAGVVTTENTRIWVICSPGSVPSLEADGGSESDGGSEFDGVGN